MRSLLEQPFEFLDTGCQCYAFLSQAQTMLLKLFKQHHFTPIPWLQSILLPSSLSAMRDRYLETRSKRFSHTFGSCYLAGTTLKEKTGCFYLHLNPTSHWKKSLEIVDKLGIHHFLDVDSSVFILQERAERVDDRVRRLMRLNQEQEAQRSLSSILTLLADLNQTQIINKDPAIKKNMGFVNNKAILIDIGSFTKSPSPLSPTQQKERLLKSTESFMRWLSKEYPSLANYLQEQLQIATCQIDLLHN